MVLQKHELMDTYGGSKTGVLIAIGGAIIFLVGIIDGYLRPLKCS